MTPTARRSDPAAVAHPVRIGTRGSALALVQARTVEAALRRKGVPSEMVIIQTAGDRRTPDTAWGEGAFVAAIQEALLDGRVDLAIHSAKDVPTQTHPRLAIGAYLKRADPRDCLVTRTGEPAASLDDLPHGARVGTDSPRRTGFLLAKRPDLRIAPLHGNVDTRLRRLDEGDTDALVLAVAGLTRLGRQDRIGAILDPKVVPPAPGQGALAVEVRADDTLLREKLSAIDHHSTRTAVEAEREVLRLSGGGCRSPIGALGRIEGRQLVLLGGYASANGRVAQVIETRGSAVKPQAMIQDLVDRLEASVGVRGAGRAWPRVLVTRPAGQAEEVVDALAAHGIDGVVVPTLTIQPISNAEREELLAATLEADWVVVTSANAANALGAAGSLGLDGQGPRWAAIGEATAEVLRLRGAEEVWLPSRADGQTLAEELPVEPGARVLLACTPLADPLLALLLRDRHSLVTQVDAYRTLTAPEASRDCLREALSGPGSMQAVTFLSASAVRGLVELAGAEWMDRCRALTAVCIGGATARAARDNGFQHVVESTEKSVAAVAALTATTLGMQREEAGA